MNPGREMDQLVAEKVTGWQIGSHNGLSNLSPEGSRWCRERNPMEGIPYYSTDIAAAWEVVEKLHLSGFTVYSGLVGPLEPHAIAKIIGRGRECEVKAETAPHAICLAALRAINALLSQP